jgi:glycosyltransferase involved in cell wall biosynthesis
MKPIVCKTCEDPHATCVDFIVPLYKSARHIPDLFERINQLGNELGVQSTLIAVLDGPDFETENAIKIYKDLASFPVKTVVLSRNFGVGPALLAGLSESEACVSMCFGSDLQEPKSLFLEFFSLIGDDKADIVLGNRRSREDPLMSRAGAAFYWAIYRRFIDSNIPKGGFDVFALNKHAKTALVDLGELNTSITSQIGWIGFRKSYVPFDRESRKIGKSSWTLRRKIKLFSDSIYGFTFLPVTIITTIGFLLTGSFLLISIATLVAALLGLVKVAGYTTLVLLIGLGNSAIIFCIGLLGGYVSRTFDNSKQRPNYIIQRKY